MKKIFDWLDNRTGYRELTKEALYEPIPGGARWRYIWGSTLSFAVMIQFITGIFLWMAYSPSAQTAWESVYYIQHEMGGGWFLRGLHHWTAQVMTVLLVLHLMQVLIDGAYKAPRELNFWTGLILLQIVLGLSLTGYLLPWDQKGYWATKVATNLMGVVPLVGHDLQRLVVGGSDYGHHTITRFFALHAGVLPMAIMAVIGGHIYLFRKHGIHTKQPHKKPDSMFWPDQVLMDAVACLAVLCVAIFFTIYFRGAELTAPADPSDQFPARPDWYFLFLFQFLKYFEGGQEVLGAVVIPGAVMGFMFLMPFLGAWKLGHRFNMLFIVALLGGAGFLTFEAMTSDKSNPTYQAALKDSHFKAERVIELAQAPSGIPPAGAVNLLQNDALVRGPQLFAQNCASCHRYDGHDGRGQQLEDPQTAPDLKGVGSREWLTGFLHPENISSVKYFGGTMFKDGKMAKWARKNLPLDDAQAQKKIKKVIIALSAESKLPSQSAIDERDAAFIKEGATLLDDDFGCTDCHEWKNNDEDATAPWLTGYGSREWLIHIISNPANPKHYGTKNDRMPAFVEQERLTEREVSMLVDWLRGDWYQAPTEH